MGTASGSAIAPISAMPGRSSTAPGRSSSPTRPAARAAVADLVVVVCEPSPQRAVTVEPLLKALDDSKTPHLIFVNKIDTLEGRVRDTMSALQNFSRRRWCCARCRSRGRGDHRLCRCGQRARLQIPQGPGLRTDPDSGRHAGRRAGSANELLEVLADHEDAIMEKILEDVAPTTDEIYGQLRKDLAADATVAVLLGRRRTTAACAACGKRCATTRR